MGSKSAATADQVARVVIVFITVVVVVVVFVVVFVVVTQGCCHRKVTEEIKTK